MSTKLVREELERAFLPQFEICDGPRACMGCWKDCIHAAVRELDNVDALIAALDEYAALLAEEDQELATLATIHGWKSSRYERGVELRARIARLRVSDRTESPEPASGEDLEGERGGESSSRDAMKTP